jgi:hypothetical protein
VITESRSATSATVRAIGPTVSRVWLIGTTPRSGYRLLPLPTLGRSPTIPHKAGGMRTDPPVSEPSPAGDMRAAMPAAVPPLDPPGNGDLRHALLGVLGNLLIRR